VNPVETYIYQQQGEEREIMSYLHDLLTQRYGLTCRMRFSIPFYDKTKWICYLSLQKKGGIELCFLHGRWMQDLNGALEAKKRVQVYGITYHKLQDINEDVLVDLIEESIRIDKYSIKELKNGKGNI